MSDSSGDAEQFSDIDVEFDFLDPVDGDYHAIKRLLTQLFDTDSDNLPLGSIADLIIDQSRQVGSVIKNSEEQGAPNSNDPFAVISVINGKELYETVAKHRQAVDCLMDYVKKRLSRNEEMKRKAENSLDKGRLGLILLERFINMPPETTPPLLKMLSQELEWAKEDKEPYVFDYYLIILKTFKEVESQLDGGEEQPKKKQKKGTAEYKLMHEEDKVFLDNSDFQVPFLPTANSKTRSTDANRVFSENGFKPGRVLAMFPHSKLAKIIEEMEALISNRE